jgi:hypothetical protein
MSDSARSVIQRVRLAAAKEGGDEPTAAAVSAGSAAGGGAWKLPPEYEYLFLGRCVSRPRA